MHDWNDWSAAPSYDNAKNSFIFMSIKAFIFEYLQVST